MPYDTFVVIFILINKWDTVIPDSSDTFSLFLFFSFSFHIPEFFQASRLPGSVLDVLSAGSFLFLLLGIVNSSHALTASTFISLITVSKVTFSQTHSFSRSFPSIPYYLKLFMQSWISGYIVTYSVALEMELSALLFFFFFYNQTDSCLKSRNFISVHLGTPLPLSSSSPASKFQLNFRGSLNDPC